MASTYWCGVCRTTYPIGPEGRDAVRDMHRRENHGGGVPEGERFDPDGPDGILTGRHVLLGLVALVMLAVAARAFGFELMG
ncbi:hypothetical protein [Streptomyces subrutilus]|uniref:Uncharacterized protein n=1 Tax=Streptomyces subrutilus TaxID=36818 RepID=A0A1E5NXB7_9ACTN|nr:hypothetical protein [Streptomyces subrutilus]OEJ20891.1 hypothetical protein BGK67_35230 [Streptomyces subrutilus]